ncbi:TonB family protein [Sphingomonas sp. UYAg733]
MLSLAIGIAMQMVVAPMLAREPQALNVEKIISPEDYPLKARDKNESGVVSIEVQVSSDGKPTSCAITESSRSSALDTTSCRLALQRLKFEPARDAGGMPMTGIYRTFMTWMIDPNFSPAALDSNLTVARLPADYARPVKMRLEFDASGHSDVCSVVESSGSIGIDQVACRQARKDVVVTPPRPAPGFAARAVRFMTLKFVAK